MSVLLIDDDPGVRQTFGRALEQAGFDVTSVGGSVAAFAAIRKKSFEAIVCDVILPIRDGTSLYEVLRERFPEMADRVIFVSGFAADEKIRQLLEYTGQPYLTKPVKLSVLVDTVQQVIDRAEPKSEGARE